MWLGGVQRAAVLGMLVLAGGGLPAGLVFARHARVPEAAGCQCTARLSYAQPELQFRDGVLTLLPRLNVSVRTRGEAEAGAWALGVAYEGAAQFTSDSVEAPEPLSFSGERQIVGGQCGSNRYSFRGYVLPEVPLSGVVRSLFGADDELDGVVRVTSRLTGCAADAVDAQFRFQLAEFGNLTLRGWRRAR